MNAGQTVTIWKSRYGEREDKIQGGAHPDGHTKKVGPFKIVKKISDLVYKLELPAIIKIHDVIFVMHLKQATIDFYERQVSLSAPIVNVDRDELWVIEKIVRQEKHDRFRNYIAKWKKYEEPTWEPAKRLIKDVFDLIKRFEAQKTKR